MRPKVLRQRNNIASQHPLKNTCFDRQKRLKSLTALKMADQQSSRQSPVSRDTSGALLKTEDGDLEESKRGVGKRHQLQPLSISDMKFSLVPHTTRSKDVGVMGHTQPVFPKVSDQLGRTADRSEFGAVTHREEDGDTMGGDPSFEGVQSSLVGRDAV